MDDDEAFLYGDAAPAADESRQGEIDLGEDNSEVEDEGSDIQEDGDSDSDVEIILDQQAGSKSFVPSVAPKAASVPQQQPVPAPLPSGWGNAATRSDLPNLRPQPVPFQGARQPDPTPALQPPSINASLNDVSVPSIGQPPEEDPDPLLGLDLDALPEKPWREPGAVTSDYFNYGFDEASWKAYVARQADERSEREREKETPFAIFAQHPLAKAYSLLPPELKAMLFQTIMAEAMSTMGGGMPGMAPMMGMPSYGMGMGMMGDMGANMGGMNQFAMNGMPAQEMQQQNRPPVQARVNPLDDDVSEGQLESEHGTSPNGLQGSATPAPPENAPTGPGQRARANPMGSGPFGRGRGAAAFGATPPVTHAALATNAAAAEKRAVSPLPANIPTGPKAMAAPTGPKSMRPAYRDKDEGISKVEDDLDYGGESVDGRESVSTKHRSRRDSKDRDRDREKDRDRDRERRKEEKSSATSRSHRSDRDKERSSRDDKDNDSSSGRRRHRSRSPSSKKRSADHLDDSGREKKSSSRSERDRDRDREHRRSRRHSSSKDSPVKE